MTDTERMKSFVKAYKPDVVIHCAAYTAVDKAEDEVELCDQINHLATKELAKVFDILPMPKGRGFLDTNDTCLLK